MDAKLPFEKTYHPSKRFVAYIPVVILLFFGGVLFHNVLRETIGQHPEDGDSPAVLEAEQLLLMDFIARHSEPTAEDFLRSWSEYESDNVRHLYVPWSCFMGPEKRIEARIEQLNQRFKENEERYFRFQKYREIRASVQRIQNAVGVLNDFDEDQQ